MLYTEALDKLSRNLTPHCVSEANVLEGGKVLIAVP